MAILRIAKTKYRVCLWRISIRHVPKHSFTIHWTLIRMCLPFKEQTLTVCFEGRTKAFVVWSVMNYFPQPPEKLMNANCTKPIIFVEDSVSLKCDPTVYFT